MSDYGPGEPLKPEGIPYVPHIELQPGSRL
jgi:hypothetical protein